MAFPLNQTIGHAIYTPGAPDSHNNPTDAWANPVDVLVYGYGPPIRTAEAEPGGTQVIQDLQIYAPVFAVDPRDRFVIGALTYMVIGEVRDWDNGPFNFSPGMVVNLKRVQGGR